MDGRPDVLFSDALSRHLLVEIQHGRLDEGHLQRHFYYFFDYRAKYPSTHLRLMFIANRVVPQHKDFLDEHGYEYREIPEQDFEKRLNTCSGRSETPSLDQREVVTTPGVLAPTTYEILYQIETQPMTMCYKMLLLMYMAECADLHGRVSLSALAEKFQEFFIRRSIDGKLEENPKRVTQGVLSRRSASNWERVIREQPVHYLTDLFLIDEVSSVRWAPRIWSLWNQELQREIRMASFDRLVRYFDRHAGGY